ncbi:MAG: hypothetical protein V3U76_06645 [Granulosicoccus sp.]
MKTRYLLLLVAGVSLLSGTTATAQNIDNSAEIGGVPIAAVQAEPQHVLATSVKPTGLNRFAWFRESDTTVLVGLKGVKLNNPSGFDIAPEGENHEPLRFNSVSIVFDHPFGSSPHVSRQTRVGLDAKDFDGLELITLGAGYGVGWHTLATRQNGVGLNIGLEAGATQSTSFLDRTYHTMAGINASLHVRLRVFILEIGAYSRKNFASTLDNRDAAPQTHGGSLSIGFRF